MSESTSGADGATGSGSSLNVDFVIEAEFDIDEGSTVRLQYPKETEMDTTFLAEAMLPEGSHARSTDETFFFIPESKGGGASGRPLLHCLSVLLARKDESVRRGSVTKAIAVCSRHPFVHVFRPAIARTLEACLESGQSGDAKLLKQLYEALNAADLSTALAVPASPWAARAAASERMRMRKRQCVADTAVKIPAPIAGAATIAAVVPGLIRPDEVGGDGVSVARLCRTFGQGVMAIFNALLAHRRVLFIGHKMHARDLCRQVLAACLLTSPPLRGTKRRAYPYTNLTNLEGLLSTDGYIAGVSNPIFAQRSQWWDVCCDISEGKVRISPGYAKDIARAVADAAAGDSVDGAAKAKASSSGAPPPWAREDHSFYMALALGLRRAYGEEWVREMWVQYTTRLIDMAFQDGPADDEAERVLDLTRNRVRIRWLKASRPFREYAEKFRFSAGTRGPLRDAAPLAAHHIRVLQSGGAPAESLRKSLGFLKKTIGRDKPRARAMLAMLPELGGGVTPIAALLLHADAGVRAGSLALMRTLDKVPEGAKAVGEINYFLLRTYWRLCVDEESNDDGKEEFHNSVRVDGTGRDETTEAKVSTTQVVGNCES